MVAPRAVARGKARKRERKQDVGGQRDRRGLKTRPVKEQMTAVRKPGKKRANQQFNPRRRLKGPPGRGRAVNVSLTSRTYKSGPNARTKREKMATS